MVKASIGRLQSAVPASFAITLRNEYTTFPRALQGRPDLKSHIGDLQSCEIFGDRDHKMNWAQIEGKWKQFKGSVKQKWGKLTDDDLDVIAGKRDQLVGKIQERYGIGKDEALKQIDDWSSRAVEPPEASRAQKAS
jgi:uncharacterized protein YjbJ (UPF0337 family)